MPRVLAVVCALLLLACGGAPRARYRVPADVGVLVTDAAAFTAFARRVHADAEARLRGTGLVEARRRDLFLLAMLDALLAATPGWMTLLAAPAASAKHDSGVPQNEVRI